MIHDCANASQRKVDSFFFPSGYLKPKHNSSYAKERRRIRHTRRMNSSVIHGISSGLKSTLAEKNEQSSCVNHEASK